MKKIYLLIIPLLLLAIGCGGRDYREAMRAPESMFYQGQALEAARSLLPEVNRSGRDQILFMMEAGYMLHIANNYEKSNQVLLRAAEMAKMTPVSISEQVKALMTNPRATTYRGEDFEKVLINMYIGINYLMNKEYEEAAVEFKRVNNELAKIKEENGTARYKQNIMAKYLAAIAHEIIADLENSDEDRDYAAVELRQILQLKPNLYMARRDLSVLEKDFHNTGELIVIFQAGQSAEKVSRGNLLDDPGMNQTINVSMGSGAIAKSLAAGVSVAAVLGTLRTAENPIPKFIYRSNQISHLNVRVKNASFRTEMLESVAETAVRNLEDDYGRLRAQLAASIVLKAATSLAAGIAAKEAARQIGGTVGQFSGLIGTVVGAGTGAALFASMKPDLRCWHTLPSNLQLGRQRLYPGQYSALIDFIGTDGSVRETRQVDFELKARERYIINTRSFY
ncbi:MAG: hypothetical protein JXA20_14955 [Spirochaetes bacterium]|nr:hypothetical protein [Spirochaetota bacterium]